MVPSGYCGRGEASGVTDCSRKSTSAPRLFLLPGLTHGVEGAALVQGRNRPFEGKRCTLDDADPPVLLGAVPTTDVLRAYVTHAPYALRTRMLFTDLRRGNRNEQSFRVEVHTPSDTYQVFVTSTQRSKSGQHRMWRRSDSGDLTPIRCRGLTHLIKYTTDTVRLRVPRTCLQQPTWVKVRLSNAMAAAFWDEAPPHYIETPHGRLIDEATLARPVFTSRLYRG